MTTYTCLKDLETKTLKQNDTVKFTVGDKKLVYQVNDSHLSAIGSNSEVFRLLSIDKEEFCMEQYGEGIANGDWPQTPYGISEEKSMEMLTRAVVALYFEIEKRRILTSY